MPNYYDVLEINKNATEDDIKKAFRKGALRWHPDKNKDNKEEAERRFKEISEANNVLSDPEKRKIYDLQGEEGVKQHEAGANNPNPGMNPFGNNPNNFFNMFFGGGGGNPFGGNPFGQHTRQNIIKKSEQKNVVIPVTLKDLYFGSKKKITIPIRRLCVGCQGMGGKNATTCVGCNGMGVVIISKMIGPNMIQQVQTICSSCNGRKKRVETPCTTCNASGTVTNDAEFVLKIDIGMDNNDKISYPNMGNENYEEERGDVVFILSLNDTDKRFTKVRNHLVYTQNIKIGDAITGMKVHIDHISGEAIIYEETGIIPDKSFRIIRGKGMPNGGDLYIYYNIQYEDGEVILTPNQKELIKRILPTTQHKQPIDTMTPNMVTIEKLNNNFSIEKII